MSEVLEQTVVEAAVAELHRALDVLIGADLEHLSDEQSVAVVRGFEQVRRRLEPVDHALLMNVEDRGIPARSGLRTTAQWLRQTTMVDIYEANARVRAAHAAGPRRSLLGERLAPVYPAVAAAQAAGDVSAKQARVITSMLTRLPVAVCEQVPDVEARLVGFCTTLDAGQLSQCAERERAWLDPDGGYRDVERRRRDRGCRFTQRPDGSCAGSFEGTAELGEFLQVVFDSLGAPRPESNGVKDSRTAGQRRHDALLDGLKAAVGAGSLPAAGGMLATVVLTMTEESYKTGQGFAPPATTPKSPSGKRCLGRRGLSCRHALVSPSSLEPAGR